VATIVDHASDISDAEKDADYYNNECDIS